MPRITRLRRKSSPETCDGLSEIAKRVLSTATRRRSTAMGFRTTATACGGLQRAALHLQRGTWRLHTSFCSVEQRRGGVFLAVFDDNRASNDKFCSLGKAFGLRTAFGTPFRSQDALKN